MLSVCAAILVLAAMASLGVALLRRFAGETMPWESPYGIPLGAVVSSLALLGLASLFGLTGAVVAIVSAGSAVIAIVIGRGRWRWSSSDLRAAFPLVAVCVLGAFAIRWAFLFWGTLSLEDTGLWAGHRNIFADWSQHLGDVTSFAFGDNFPPTNPRLSGAPLAYHYLTSITAAALVVLGASPMTALVLHSFVFSLAILLALYAFAKRLTKRAGAAALTVVLFLLGGGLGWIVTVRETMRSHHAWSAFVAQPGMRTRSRPRTSASSTSSSRSSIPNGPFSTGFPCRSSS
jgi:hypothetical protein